MSESALSVYLRSVARLYPAGIPRAVFGRGRAKAALTGAAVLFLSGEPSAAGEGAPFADQSGELLRGAIEKGLKLPLERAEVLRSADAKVIAERFSVSTAPLVVCLGSKAAQAVDPALVEASELVECGGKRVLCTVELSLSATDAVAKRRFWQDLQRLLAAIA